MEEVSQKVEKKRSWEEILQRRMRVIEDPKSIAIAARTREGMILSDLVYDLDRAVSRIRGDSGTFIPVPSVVESLRKVSEFIKEFSQFVNSSFGDGGIVFESFESRKTVASHKRALVFTPRSPEAKEVAYLVKRLDPALVEFRNFCTDFSKTEALFKRLVELIIKFESLVKELYSMLGMQFRSPKMFKTLMNVSQGSSAVESQEEVQEPESQESTKKGKK